ncbi:MAG: DUF4438 domain-containing protein [Candidatus Muirbacterium halophilum]|nr:DUF4438 domain-containing protein [Candidatus Muirbacterium halophilum]MCK9476289.1 DUF4438 domain-containing protein [Candidatus Muirbacterium halophilum]
MLKTNEKNLVKMLIQGKIAYPVKFSSGFNIDHNGKGFDLPSIGGINLNVQIGDTVYDWEGDHVEPGVSTCFDIDKRNSQQNIGFNFYSCAGNKATIISACDKKIIGKTGTVIGHHGGAEHVVMDFPQDILEKMTYKDEIMVTSFGQGLKLTDYPEIKLYNLCPELLKKMKITEKKENNKKTLNIPVTAIIPGELMGSGVGSISVGTGDYDIMTMDREYLKKHNLLNLKFGDFVAIVNHDNRYGRCYREGAVAIGIIIHSDCKMSGHGPGVTTLIADVDGIIKPVISKDANIGNLLKIGRFR